MENAIPLIAEKYIVNQAKTTYLRAGNKKN